MDPKGRETYFCALTLGKVPKMTPGHRGMPHRKKYLMEGFKAEDLRMP